MARPFDPYRNIRRTEPDLRQELENTLDGVFPEIAKKQTIVLRRFRRDSVGKRTLCACVDINTKEPDKDSFCPFCQGEGYFWDETYIDAYKVQVYSGIVGANTAETVFPGGLMNVPLMVFYTRSSVVITKEDKIVQIQLDNEGDAAIPLKRIQLYRIGSLVDYRSDNGRLEYWKINCFAEERKFLNGPRI